MTLPNNACPMEEDGAPEEGDENRRMTKCLRCGYLNLLDVTTCHNCRLHFVKISHEDNQRELAALRERIGIRTVWTIRGFQSNLSRDRKNARKQLNDLSDEMITKINIQYYTDLKDCLVKTLLD